MAAKYPTNAVPRTRPDVPRPRPHRPFAPRPAGWPARPIPKIPPLPKGSPFLLGKVIGKGLARLVPGLGIALTAYELYDYFYSGGPATLNRAKWDIYKACSGEGWRWSEGQVFNNCNGFQIPDTRTPTSYAGIYENIVPPGWTNFKTYKFGYNTGFGNDVYIKTDEWILKAGASGLPDFAGSTFIQPGTNPFPTPNLAPKPRIEPQINPQHLPINRPIADPFGAPRPVGRPAPGEQPNNMPRQKGKPRQSSRPRPETYPAPTMPFPVTAFPNPIGNLPSPVQPDISVDIRPPRRGEPSPRPQPRNRPPSGRNKPPRSKKEKEKKVHVRTVAGGFWAAINTFTEGVDFLGVLYDSLPEDSLCKKAAEKAGRKSGKNYVNPYQQAKAVYNCYDDIDLANTIENYVNNQVEDMVYGAIGQQLGKASGKFGLTTGLNRAIKNQQDLAGQLTGASIGDLIPVIDIDDETGEFSVTVPQFGTVNFGKFGDGRITVKRPTKEKR